MMHHGMGHGPGGMGRGPMGGPMRGGHHMGPMGGPMHGRRPMGPPPRRHYFPIFTPYFGPRYYGYRTGGCLAPLFLLFLLGLLFRF